MVVAANGKKVHKVGKRLTRGKQLSEEQAVEIRKLRLRRLQRIKKQKADRMITRMLGKLSMNPTIEKKRKRTINRRSEKVISRVWDQFHNVFISKGYSQNVV
ncbi:uncharacterized protein EAF01_004521 [Botrytis porri]|uniref:uncharacterized protein n=1 Tax=Botrytis porri TaxID=87229 RepID=UPI0019016D48|nr:uncharacterized protein EAF01_004521 [Botrytis porri]KAF7908766.1 hypothetical protein EAF01_004521 [Botrytis porri]